MNDYPQTTPRLDPGRRGPARSYYRDDDGPDAPVLGPALRRLIEDQSEYQERADLYEDPDYTHKPYTISSKRPNKRTEALIKTSELINKNRNTSYGEPENNFKRIAAFWSTYLGRKILPHEVADLMLLVKVARNMESPTNYDNTLDAIGYAALSYELTHAEAERGEPLLDTPTDSRMTELLDTIANLDTEVTP